MKNFKCQFEIQSDFKYLPFLTRIFKALKINQANALTQILVEAYNNAVVHGHCGKKGKWVGIGIDVGKKRVKIWVRDGGMGMGRGREKGQRTNDKGERTNDKGLWETTGRGLQIINALADKVTHKYKNKRHLFEATYFL